MRMYVRTYCTYSTCVMRRLGRHDRYSSITFGCTYICMYVCITRSCCSEQRPVTHKRYTSCTFHVMALRVLFPGGGTQGPWWMEESTNSFALIRWPVDRRCSVARRLCRWGDNTHQTTLVDWTSYNKDSSGHQKSHCMEQSVYSPALLHGCQPQTFRLMLQLPSPRQVTVRLHPTAGSTNSLNHPLRGQQWQCPLTGLPADISAKDLANLWLVLIFFWGQNTQEALTTCRVPLYTSVNIFEC